MQSKLSDSPLAQKLRQSPGGNNKRRGKRRRKRDHGGIRWNGERVGNDYDSEYGDEYGDEYSEAARGFVPSNGQGIWGGADEDCGAGMHLPRICDDGSSMMMTNTASSSYNWVDTSVDPDILEAATRQVLEVSAAQLAKEGGSPPNRFAAQLLQLWREGYRNGNGGAPPVLASCLGDLGVMIEEGQTLAGDVMGRLTSKRRERMNQLTSKRNKERINTRTVGIRSLHSCMYAHMSNTIIDHTLLLCTRHRRKQN